MKRIHIALFLALLSCNAFSQDFAGSFTCQTETGLVMLTLKSKANGEYAGTLEATGLSLSVLGKVKQKVLEGRVGGESESFGFRAQWRDKQLSFEMYDVDDEGNPVSESKESLTFQRTSSSGGASVKPTEQSRGGVVVNGVSLSEAQVAEIEKTYGVRPKEGKYWYDAKSGLYGVVGFPAYGYMQPNHRFGSMKSNVSKGTTGVFINGRELPPMEYTVWSYIVGSWIQPGRYWLDHEGNAGYEGNPAPVINLFVAAKQNGYHGQGASGDNFWTSRFSAGNSDSDGKRGYVSVPGYGPVGYGF